MNRAEVEKLEKEYAAAQTGCVLMDASVWGRLAFTGKNSLDFLNRMSTNDLHALQVGQGAGTVFTTPLARIIDRVVVYARDGDVLMLTSRGNQGRVMQWLRKYIFFGDDVQIKDVTGELGMLSIYGSTSMELVRQVTGEKLSALELHHWRAAQFAGVEITIGRADPIGGGGFHLIGAQASMPALRSALIDAGCTSSGEETYQVLRVEAGCPEFGHELGDEYIPLEANLWADVSFKKGCYTGQEIIARMESRQKLAKQLQGLRFEGEVNLPAALYLEEHEVGVVTSVVCSPALGWIGLGYLKPNAAAPGQVVQSRHADQAVAASVSAIPFNPM